MHNIKYGVIFLILVLGLLLPACATQTSPTAAPTLTATPTPTATATPTTLTPQKGGILRFITPATVTNLSYYPEMGPVNWGFVLPAVEKLFDYNPKHEIVGVLGESWEVSKDNKAMIFHLKKGIKFSDGSDFNAEVAKWNLEYSIKGGMPYGSNIVSMVVTDDYTLTLNLNTYNNQLIHNYGWQPMFSKAAFENAGGGDIEKSKTWARQNVVGTGPFLLKEWKRDVSLTWVKNPNYWQPGKPYLDGIEVSIIPDPVTASTMMQAKQADWFDRTTPRYEADLVSKGLVRQSGYGFPTVLWFNTVDSNSVWQNQKLREAVEYALDKAAMAKTLGYGFYPPLTMIASPGEWGYDPNYKGRPYDPQKAKQLLAEAGYSNGVQVKLLAQTGAGGRNVDAEAVKGYLDAVGIQTTLDIADTGRFNSEMYKTGWSSIMLNPTGLDPNFLSTFVKHYSPDAMSNRISFKRSPELTALYLEGLYAVSDADQKAITAKLVRQMADEAAVIPMWLASRAYVIQPYVHTTFLQEQMTTCYWENVWMDKH